MRSVITMAVDSPTPTKLGFIGAGIMGASRIRTETPKKRFFSAPFRASRPDVVADRAPSR